MPKLVHLESWVNLKDLKDFCFFGILSFYLKISFKFSNCSDNKLFQTRTWQSSAKRWLGETKLIFRFMGLPACIYSKCKIKISNLKNFYQTFLKSCFGYFPHFSFLFDNNLFNSKVKKICLLGLQEVEWFKRNWPPFWKPFSIIVLNYPAVLENNAELLNEV